MQNRMAFSLLTALTLAGCGAGSGSEPVDPVEQEQYDFRGSVVSADPDEGTVLVDHEEIRGLMDGMTMDFPLRDRWAFNEMAPGDRIEAVLVVQGDEYWLEQVVLSRRPDTPAPEIPVDRLGEPLPDVVLVDQDGDAVRIGDFRGKTLLITFIYTRCPLADFCPRMTEQFETIEKELKQRSELYATSHLLTISFDTEYDTPERLREYARTRAELTDEGFQHWTFASGDEPQVRELANFLNLEYTSAHGEIVHNLRTAVVAPDGSLVQVFRGNSWEAPDVVDAVASMASNEDP